MSGVTWWAFSAMRNDAAPRTWLRWSELWAWVQAEFPALGQWDVRQAISQADKPEKKYWHNRYTIEHQAAIRAYAERAGLQAKETANG